MEFLPVEWSVQKSALRKKIPHQWERVIWHSPYRPCQQPLISTRQKFHPQPSPPSHRPSHRLYRSKNQVIQRRESKRKSACCAVHFHRWYYLQQHQFTTRHRDDENVLIHQREHANSLPYYSLFHQRVQPSLTWKAVLEGSYHIYPLYFIVLYSIFLKSSIFLWGRNSLILSIWSYPNFVCFQTLVGIWWGRSNLGSVQ